MNISTKDPTFVYIMPRRNILSVAHADLRGLLAPGATLVPAGVAAMDALQAEHFT